LFLGVGTAVILGIGSSILQLIQQASHPRMARVGRLDEVHTNATSNITAEQDMKIHDASQRVDYDDSRFRDVVRFPNVRLHAISHYTLFSHCIAQRLIDCRPSLWMVFWQFAWTRPV
jgi:MFS superfamily sulfate permease-like transporter